MFPPKVARKGIKDSILNNAFSEYLKIIVFKDCIKEAYQEIIKHIASSGLENKRLNLEGYKSQSAMFSNGKHFSWVHELSCKSLGVFWVTIG